MMLLLGITDAGAAPGPEMTREGELKTQEVPPGLEEWVAEGPI